MTIAEKNYDLLQKANEIKDYVSKLRNQIHMNPELGFKEINTAALIKKELVSYGVEVLDIDVPTGVLGVLKGQKIGGNTVTAIRADIDALPIQEQTGFAFSSCLDGIMHACGHDGHTAMLLGVAKLLATMTADFSGTVKFIFQPGEEVLGGAEAMVKAGVLENPKVDNIIALHSWPYLPTGVIGTWKGAYYAAADAFEAKIIGGSGHGAYPHKSNDSLLAATHAVTALQALTSRQLNAIENTVMSICTFHAGTAFNIIPEFSTFSGTVRTHSEEIRKSIPAKMEKIIKGVAEAFGCQYEFKYRIGISTVNNNPDVVDDVIAAIHQSLGEQHVTTLPGPVMGSEDFSEYSKLIKKSAIFRIGTTNPGDPEIPLHSGKYNFNNDTIPYGITAIAQYVLNTNR